MLTNRVIMAPVTQSKYRKSSRKTISDVISTFQLKLKNKNSLIDKPYTKFR